MRVASAIELSGEQRTKLLSLRRGVFTSVPDLVTAIEEYIAHHNTNPKPFIWTKSARDILRKVIRANSTLSGMALTLSPTRDHGARSFAEPGRAGSSTTGRVLVVAFAFAARCVRAGCAPCTARSG